MAKDEPPPLPELTERVAPDGEVLKGYTLPDMLAWIRETHAYHLSRLVGLCGQGTQEEITEHAFGADAMLRASFSILIEFASDAVIFHDDTYRNN